MSEIRVIAEIMASRAAVRVVERGVVVRSLETVFERNDWGENWAVREEELTREISRLVDELGVRGRKATVVYDVPGTACAVVAAPEGASASEAMESARLAAESELTGADEPGETAMVFLDEPGEHRRGKRRFTLACADSETALRRVCAIAENAGLRVKAVVPTEACAIIEAMSSLGARSELPRVSCWIGWHAMAIAISSADGLLGVRTMELGLSALAEAMLRPAGGGREGSSRAGMSRAQAWSTLAEIGVPAPDAVLPGDSNLSGASVLPAMQPVLQRLAVEIKQSLRFELKAGVREGARLRVVGPGSKCPGLEATLCRLVGVEPGKQDPGMRAEPADGECQALVSGKSVLPALLPRAMIDRVVRRRARIGATIGAVLAVAFAMHDRVDARQRAQAARGQAESLGAVLAPMRAESEAWRRGLEAGARLEQSRARLRKAVGDGPSVPAAARALAQASTTGVVLTSADFSGLGNGEGGLVVSGFVPMADDGEAAALIRAFVGALESSALVSAVRLGSTQRSSMNGHEVHLFTVTADLIGIPSRARLVNLEAPE